MQFTDLTFLFIFLPLLLAAYYIAKEEYRQIVLLVFSLAFYSFGSVVYVVPLCLMCLFNYAFAVLISGIKESKPFLGKLSAVFCIVFNILPLAYYKYFGFIAGSASQIIHFDYVEKNLLVPLGISFFTFKAISYIVDVYKGVIDKVDFLQMTSYLSFFAQIQSGPIERYSDFSVRVFNKDLFYKGCTRFMIGFSKKVIIADVLCNIVSEVFDETVVLSTGITWLGSICFSLQLYYDFSGYSDMAIGIGNMLGIECPENFKFPYATQSVSEFWRRWHISLGNWFRDYIYIPMGGSRCGKVRIYFNLFIVWLLTGLWHGANWQFIVWGLGYFIVISMEKGLDIPGRLNSPLLGNLYRIPVLLFINFQWVLFRSGTLGKGIQFLKRMILFDNNSISALRAGFLFKDYFVFILLAIIFAVPFPDYIEKKTEKNGCIKKAYESVSGVLIACAFIIALSFVVSGQNNPFLYGNF